MGVTKNAFRKSYYQEKKSIMKRGRRRQFHSKHIYWIHFCFCIFIVSSSRGDYVLSRADQWGYLIYVNFSYERLKWICNVFYLYVWFICRIALESLRKQLKRWATECANSARPTMVGQTEKVCVNVSNVSHIIIVWWSNLSISTSLFLKFPYFCARHETNPKRCHQAFLL